MLNYDLLEQGNMFLVDPGRPGAAASSGSDPDQYKQILQFCWLCWTGVLVHKVNDYPALLYVLNAQITNDIC